MKIHIVKKDETMQSIAKKYNISLNTLVDMNKQIANPDLIMPGMKIKVPMDIKKEETVTRETKETKSSKDSVSAKTLDMSDRYLEAPHAQNKPKRLPDIQEDESTFPDKEMVPYSDGSEEEIFNKVVSYDPILTFNSYDSTTNEQNNEETSESRNNYSYTPYNPIIQGPVPYSNLSGVGQTYQQPNVGGQTYEQPTYFGSGQMYPQQGLSGVGQMHSQPYQYQMYSPQMMPQQFNPYYNAYQSNFMNPYQYTGMNPYYHPPSPCGCGS